AEPRHDEGARVTNCNSSGNGSLADAVAGARSGSTITISASCSSENPITPADVIPITSSLTIKASRSERAVISGGTTHSIFTVAPGAVVSLEGLTLRDAVGTASFALVGAGGAINNDGNLSLANDVFENNRGVGGAAVSSTGSLTIEKCTFRHGTAFIGSSILSSGGNVQLSDSEISDNTALEGGLVLLSGSLTVRHSVVTRNTAQYDVSGIAVVGSPSGRLLVSDSIISNNNGGQVGGGILTNDGVAATIERSTISNNTAVDGAGIYNQFGTLIVRDSVFSGNKASGSGGAIFSLGDTASVGVTSSRFSNNTGASLPTKYQGLYIAAGGLTVRGSDFGSSRDGGANR
ncbi:MAG: right-handed parallel beta-helix repeat-containing protein, partial [Actinomycetes bacterium]